MPLPPLNEPVMETPALPPKAWAWLPTTLPTFADTATVADRSLATQLQYSMPAIATEFCCRLFAPTFWLEFVTPWRLLKEPPIVPAALWSISREWFPEPRTAPELLAVA